MNYFEQSDLTMSSNLHAFWGRRDPFFRNNPAALDRRADIELLAGRHAVAERLAHLAAEMREAHA